MSEQPARYDDDTLQALAAGRWYNPATKQNEPTVAAVLAQEVQERRALDAQRKCATCAHGVVGVPGWIDCLLSPRMTNLPDWFCANWEAKP